MTDYEKSCTQGSSGIEGESKGEIKVMKLLRNTHQKSCYINVFGVATKQSLSVEDFRKKTS
jgi:hypothetical protein